MQRHNSSKIRVRAPLLAVAVLLLGAALIWRQELVVAIENMHEDVYFSIHPSPELAFAYGERHFSASDRERYDIDRAQKYLELARRMEPTTPYVYHELARIAFLRGDFTRALQLIDSQIVLFGDTAPHSYYVRGLIEGFMGEYAAAADDFEKYLQFEPHNWAGLNDYAWVLLKAHRFEEALAISERGLLSLPGNAWLLNARATALFELGRYNEALDSVRAADIALRSVTETNWLHSYPGNDPALAGQGLSAFRAAVANNLAAIQARSERESINLSADEDSTTH